ncbi:MAG: polysaccharide pyruvyl transferase family protein [Hespellia sp.]|jgi:hypothetical protein|nr:polysaccharide pyruvyl transferase family protein [Hespellia sp.]
MKKIGILTFHYADNYGAVLQAYALRKVLNRFSGYEAEIINFVPEGYHYRGYVEEDLMKRFLKKRKKFESFLSEKCGIYSPMIHTIKETNYDYYCVGSDQVWNTDLPEAKNYTYFLEDLADDAVRFSYAASIGMDFNKMNKKLFHKYLSKFSYIGIREQSYIDVMNSICNKNCVHTIDPTLLLSREDYDLLIEEYGQKEKLPENIKKYVLYIWYGENWLQGTELVNSIARKYGLTILHNYPSKNIVARKMLCSDGGYIFDKGIEEFLWYIKHADFVVTNSYHVGIFSMIFRRPLYSYIFSRRRSRQEDLAEILGIKNRIVRGYVKPDDLNKTIDYESVDSAIKNVREYSLAYLQNVLKV